MSQSIEVLLVSRVSITALTVIATPATISGSRVPRAPTMRPDSGANTTVITGTLPADVLRARLAGAGGDAVAILKLGRTFDKVRAALAETGLLDRAQYVERAGTDAQRVTPLTAVDPATVPYRSLALVPGRVGRREGA